MDPFASLNLATSVIQFIDFGSKLLSGTYEIYHSIDGQTKDNAELSERTAILRKLASSLTNRPSSDVPDNKSQTGWHPADAKSNVKLIEAQKPTAIVPSGAQQPSNSEPTLTGSDSETNTASPTEDDALEIVDKDTFDESFIQLPSEKDDKLIGSNNKLGVEQAYQKLLKLTSKVKSNSATLSLEDIQRSDHEESLQKVANGCTEIAKRLEGTLSKLRVDPKNDKFRKFISFRQAISKSWSQRKIDAMEKMLEKQRNDLILHLVVIMNDQQSSVVRELRSLRDASSRLGSAYEEHLDTISNSFRLIQAEATKDSAQREKRLAAKSILARNRDDDDEEGADGRLFSLFNLHKSQASPGHGDSSKNAELQKEKAMVIDDESTQGFQFLAETLSSLVSTASDIAVAQRVLGGLHYKTMTMRMESVVEAYTDTYEWIFKTQRARAQKGIKVHFAEWLTKRDGIFWVSGKPGSGKSTLMKFLCDHQRTKEALVNWAQPLDPVMSTHFFWSSGTTMQKSQEGLLRSLLYDVFKKSPKIMKNVCRQRWEAARRGEGEWESWTVSELRRTLTSLATCQGLGYKFCFFIDGLDEYEGDHSEMISILQSLAASPNIKLCVSSRPWNVFEDAYGKLTDRKLYLQDLTNNDIRLYVRRKLEEHPNWQVLPSETRLYHSLLAEVTTKAQGVFLWVYLVIRSLHEGLTNGDSLPALERRIRKLPADLEPFFKHMLNSVDSFYHTQMVRTFQVAMGSPSPLPLMIYSFLDEDDEHEDFALRIPVKQMPMSEVDRRQAQLRRRLNGRCKGLLEVYKNSTEGEYMGYRVDFLHRTVRDFLRTKEMSDFLAAKAESNGGPNTLVFKGFVALIKSIPFEEIEMSEDGSLSVILRDAMHYACKAELESGESQTELLDDLYCALRFYATTIGKPIPWYPNCYSLAQVCDLGYAPCQSFLEFAVQSGLCVYVEGQLRLNHQTHDAKQPLLHCALSHVPKYTIEEPDLTDMVRLLLDDWEWSHPEAPSPEIWISFMNAFAHILLDEDNTATVSDMVKHRQGVLELLLSRGADPNSHAAEFEPSWYPLLVAATSRTLPPLACATMIQIFKTIFASGARLSWRGWSSADFLDEALRRESDEVDVDAARLEFQSQMCCLLIAHGVKLTAAQKSVVRQKFPPRLLSSIFSAIDQQNSEVKCKAAPVQTGSLGVWRWVSWLGW